jgi:hypothetical protein
VLLQGTVGWIQAGFSAGIGHQVFYIFRKDMGFSDMFKNGYDRVWGIVLCVNHSRMGF